MVTDQNANVVGRHDYLPFGEEIAANTGGRNGLFGTQDFVNQKFTGQERDSETGLDFFQARYFSAALGRFNSPDPSNAGASLFNPQSWNGYTYVTNNPLTLIDPSGASPLDWFDPSPDDPCADDPFICGGSGFPYPDFPSPWPSEQPQLPPPPPPPAPIVIPHTAGVFAQGQWGGFSDTSIYNNLLPNPTTVATETVVDKILKIAIGAAIPIFVVDVLLNPSPAGGKSEIEFENANRLREVAARRAKWACTASCNLQGIGENPPPYPRVTGTGTGSNENEACLNAKRSATQSAPPGTYPRHCQCVCSAQ
jgi:RHS repeat-associated protein